VWTRPPTEFGLAIFGILHSYQSRADLQSHFHVRYHPANAGLSGVDKGQIVELDTASTDQYGPGSATNVERLEIVGSTEGKEGKCAPP